MGGILFLFASDFLLLIIVGLCMPDHAVQQSKERLIQLDKIRLEGKKGGAEKSSTFHQIFFLQ